MTEKQFNIRCIIAHVIMLIAMLGLIWSEQDKHQNCVRLQPVGAYLSGVSDSIK